MRVNTKALTSRMVVGRNETYCDLRPARKTDVDVLGYAGVQAAGTLKFCFMNQSVIKILQGRLQEL